MYTPNISGLIPTADMPTRLADMYGKDHRFVYGVGMTEEELRVALDRRQEALREIPDTKEFRKQRHKLLTMIVELSLHLEKLEDQLEAYEKQVADAAKRSAARKKAPSAKKKPAARRRKKQAVIVDNTMESSPIGAPE